MKMELKYDKKKKINLHFFSKFFAILFLNSPNTFLSNSGNIIVELYFVPFYSRVMSFT